MPRPLRIGLLSYRSNPHCGGQGVYVQNLAQALCELGHRVTVISGPPYPELTPGVDLCRLPSLDLYNPADPFRTPTPGELIDPVNLIEWCGMSTMGFPEPLTFGMRAARYLRNGRNHFDILHDNQCLSYGIWQLARRSPLVATIHHPITVDRDIAVRAVKPFYKKLKQLRWYSFIGMQKKVARTLRGLITVSSCARQDIASEFGIAENRFHVVPNGIRTDLFYPLPDIDRQADRVIVTNSADTPLKGLYYLLKAVAHLAASRPALRLVVIGQPKKDGGIVRLIRRLGIGDRITFTGRISNAEFIRQYARAAVAVVPSVYEGFGLPAGEAMACGVPVISTTGGALPEVVGDAGVLVPPADHLALAGAMSRLLDHPDRAAQMGQAGYRRVMQGFTWRAAARRTVAAYREVIDDYRRFPAPCR